MKDSTEKLPKERKKETIFHPRLGYIETPKHQSFEYVRCAECGRVHHIKHLKIARREGSRFTTRRALKCPTCSSKSLCVLSSQQVSQPRTFPHNTVFQHFKCASEGCNCHFSRWENQSESEGLIDCPSCGGTRLTLYVR